jgi:hypothetical protein
MKLTDEQIVEGYNKSDHGKRAISIPQIVRGQIIFEQGARYAESIANKEIARLEAKVVELDEEGGYDQRNAVASHLESVRHLETIAKLEARVEELEEALKIIAQWEDAYPKSVFLPLTDSEYVSLCENAGYVVDCVSAHVLRAVAPGISKVAKEALAGEGKTND